MADGLNYKSGAAAQQSVSLKVSNIDSRRRRDFCRPENDARRGREAPAESLRIKNISSNRIIGSLSAYEAARLMPHLDFVSLPRGAEIYRAGETSRHVYFPETAVVSYLYELADGAATETAMIGGEGATGLAAVFGSRPSAHRAQATVGGTAWRIKTAALKAEFARGGTMQTMLLAFVNEHVNQISQRLVCKSFHLIEKRLCTWLLMLDDRVRNNLLMLTQENAALLLGANRPTISLAAQTLRAKGLLDYSRGKFHLTNRRGLETTACECYSILRTNALPDESSKSLRAADHTG